jgi:hypothetical protein
MFWDHFINFRNFVFMYVTVEMKLLRCKLKKYFFGGDPKTCLLILKCSFASILLMIDKK